MDFVQRGGGSDLNQNCSRHFFPLGFGHVPEGGGLVDPNPNYVKALSWLNLDIMVKKGPCSCPRKQGGGGQGNFDTVQI